MIKAAHVGLWFSLMSGVALAQTAPNGAPAPVSPMPQSAATAPAPDGAGPAPAPQFQPMPQGRGSDEPYEGEIIQTPNGTYMVAQPPGGAQDAGPEAGPGPGEPDAMGAHPHPGRRMMPPSKAAHFRIKGPDLALDVKCPDDEPVKACVDAVSQLLDKAAPPHH